MIRKRTKARKGTRPSSPRWRIGLAALLPAVLLLVGSVTATSARADTPPGYNPAVEVTGLNGSCLDDWGQNTYEGAPLDAYAQCNGSPAQLWFAGPSSGLVLGTSLNLLFNWCADVNNGQVFAGNKVQLWPCNGQPSQMWEQYPGGALHFNNTNYCLDIPSYQVTPVGASSPIQLDIWPCDGGPNQNWSAIPGITT